MDKVEVERWQRGKWDLGCPHGATCDIVVGVARHFRVVAKKEKGRQ